MSRFKIAAIAIIAAIGLAGCTAADTGQRVKQDAPATKITTPDTDEQLTIFATTGHLADAAGRIAPDAEIITLVGPGGDPHTYQPTTADIAQMREADLVLWNGLELEAQMTAPLESLGDKQLAVAEKLPKDRLIPVQEQTAGEHYDPHVWNDPHLWQIAVTEIADKLIEIDPERATTYSKNAADYRAELLQAHGESLKTLSKVKMPRILVTGHDAFGYLGKAYNLNVYATDRIATDAALNAQEMDELATLIATNKVPAIFYDSQANPQAINSLKEAVAAKGWEVKVVNTELYADTLGADPEVDTHLEVLLHNATTIATELGTL